MSKEVNKKGSSSTGSGKSGVQKRSGSIGGTGRTNPEAGRVNKKCGTSGTGPKGKK